MRPICFPEGDAARHDDRHLGYRGCRANERELGPYACGPLPHALQPEMFTLLILFTESLGVRFAVRIEEFFAALLPRRLELGRCDVPVGPALPGDCT